MREHCLAHGSGKPFSKTQGSPGAFAGLLGFPPKELQYRFLSQFTSVFYIRQRDYSKVRNSGLLKDW